MDKRLLALFILLLAACVIALLHKELAAWQQAAILLLALFGAHPLAEGMNKIAWLAGLALFSLVLVLELCKQLV